MTTPTVFEPVTIQGKCDMYRKMQLKLTSILYNTNVCCICLEDNQELWHLNDSITISKWEGTSFITLFDVVDMIFGEKLTTILCSELICEGCKAKLVDTYTFIVNIQHVAEIIQDSVHQINEKLDKIEPNLNLEMQYNNILINLENPINLDAKSETLSDHDYSDNVKHENEPELKENIGEVKIILCDHCGLQFKTKRGIVKHMLATHKNLSPGEKTEVKIKKNIIKCPECKETNCVHKKYLISYKKQFKLKQGIVKCIDCDYHCSKRRLLLAHVNRDHLKKFTCICEKCCKPFHSKLAYKAHVRSFHTVWLSCEYCDMKFKQKTMLKVHENICSKEKRQFKCDKCPASFSGKNKLAYHRKKHIKQYPCKMCLKVFSDQRILDKHILNHSQNLTKIFSCSYCDIQFKTLALRKKHNNEVHGDAKLRCNLCDLEFTSTKHYRWHQDTVQHQKKLNPAVKFRFECDYCDYSTKATEMLEAHVNRYHLKIAPYECNVCQRKFTGAKLLNGHMKSHEGIKKQCEICGKYLGGPSALKRHMRLHTGEKPYSCDVCGEKFSNTCLKNIHLTKRHSVKSVACPLCNSMFYSLSLMRCHFKQQHWKSKEKFDFKKVPELKEEFYDLFRDRRRVVV